MTKENFIELLTDGEPAAKHCTITATLRHFSCCHGDDSVSTEYDCDSDHFRDNFEATFYANGNCPKNEGHVSIIFKMIRRGRDICSGKYVSFSCTASVIDARGDKRIPQSFAFHPADCLEYIDKVNYLVGGFGFEGFLKRSTLLSSSSELLPDDSLTLHLEIDYETLELREPKYDAKYLTLEKDGCYLLADSHFVRDLCEMSPVLRRMLESPMNGKRASGRIQISLLLEELGGFRSIFDLLSEGKCEVSLSDVRDMYVLADKYDMREVTRLCHQLLISVVRSVDGKEALGYVGEEIGVISELAERFQGDEILGGILKMYSDIKNEVEGGTGELDDSAVSGLKYYRCTRERGPGRKFLLRKIEAEGSIDVDAFK